MRRMIPGRLTVVEAQALDGTGTTLGTTPLDIRGKTDLTLHVLGTATGADTILYKFYLDHVDTIPTATTNMHLLCVGADQTTYEVTVAKGAKATIRLRGVSGNWLWPFAKASSSQAVITDAYLTYNSIYDEGRRVFTSVQSVCEATALDESGTYADLNSAATDIRGLGDLTLYTVTDGTDGTSIQTYLEDSTTAPAIDATPATTVTGMRWIGDDAATLAQLTLAYTTGQKVAYAFISASGNYFIAQGIDTASGTSTVTLDLAGNPRSG